jgi:hypothetical protein
MPTSAVAAAAAAFEETLEEFGFADPEAALGDPVELGRRAALLVAAQAAWREHLGPLLDTKQVQLLLGVRTRQAVNDLVKRRRLLGLPTKGRRLLLPAFQFTTAGRPYPVLPDILETFEGAVVSPWTVASWFNTPQPLLKKKTPAEWLQLGRDPGLLKEAARHSASRLGK